MPKSFLFSVLLLNIQESVLYILRTNDLEVVGSNEMTHGELDRFLCGTGPGIKSCYM